MIRDIPVGVTRDELIAFMLARAEAISNYSSLEQAMCACFSHFSNTHPRVAGTIFFKISNARARRDILDELKREALGVKYSGFWDSLMKMAAPLDDQRNLVVHWTVALSVFQNGAGDIQIRRPILKKPNFFAWTADTPELYKEDLDKFSQRCDILSEALYGFLKAVCVSTAPDVDTWREICQRPLDDPLPPDHPLYPRTKGR